MEINRHGYNSLIPKLEGMFRSDINNLIDTSVIGVEINPEAKRKDIFIGSFDDLQEQWANTFAVLYSNSFDQSQDPSRTAREWRRILKPGGIAIVSYSETAPTPTDPVGNLTYKDILTLFPGELLYFEKNGSTYHDVMIRL
jgi:SAM-dependent methyltransferase